jgi:DEAD/DEAH box helicase domain-containing protein
MDQRDIAEYVRALCASEALGPFVSHHRIMPGRPARTSATARPWPGVLPALLAARGIRELYSHQATACDLVRAGRHVAVATPTASGKSLIYLLPVLEQFLRDPESRAVLLFPLKALAQDQLRVIEELLAPLPVSAKPRAAILDGDTSPHFRRKLRENPPNILLTNPEMLHLALLPHHENWSVLFAGLTHVVVDEMHTYRGVMGSHMATCSAGFPGSAAATGPGGLRVLLGHHRQSRGTGPGSDRPGRGRRHRQRRAAAGRHFLFVNPPGSASTAAVHLLRAALHRDCGPSSTPSRAR